MHNTKHNSPVTRLNTAVFCGCRSPRWWSAGWMISSKHVLTSKLRAGTKFWRKHCAGWEREQWSAGVGEAAVQPGRSTKLLFIGILIIPWSSNVKAIIWHISILRIGLFQLPVSHLFSNRLLPAPLLSARFLSGSNTSTSKYTYTFLFSSSFTSTLFSTTSPQLCRKGGCWREEDRGQDRQVSNLGPSPYLL